LREKCQCLIEYFYQDIDIFILYWITETCKTETITDSQSGGRSVIIDITES